MALSERSVLELPDAHCRQKPVQRWEALLDSFLEVSDCLLPCSGPNPLVKQQEAGCVHLSSCGLWHRHVLILVYHLGPKAVSGETASV